MVVETDIEMFFKTYLCKNCFNIILQFPIPQSKTVENNLSVIFLYALPLLKLHAQPIETSIISLLFGATAPIGPWPTFMKLSVSLRFSKSLTVGRTPWAGD
jgi:hypothetical protein